MNDKPTAPERGPRRDREVEEMTIQEAIFNELPCKPTELLERLCGGKSYSEREVKEALAELLANGGPVELTSKRVLQRRRPTIAELEAILRDDTNRDVELTLDGRVIVTNKPKPAEQPKEEK